jgi:tripartite-type tricarboxylate transporter receptor subunit TctC
MRPEARYPRRATLALAATAGITAVARAQAPSWPTRSVRVVVPTVPGGALDTVARMLCQRLSEAFGQNFVVENRGGAAGIVGMDTVAKAPPDGHTLLFAAAPIALNTALGMSLPYDPLRDFAPISLVASIPALAVAHPATPFHTLADLIEAGRTPQGIAMGVANAGAVTHLMAEVLRARSGPNFTVVTYRGAGQGIQDALAGRVQAFYDALVPTGQQVQAGRLRGIAIGSRQRSPLLPDVPTVVEQGMPELLGSGFYGLLAPARTPEAMVRAAHAAVAAALAEGSELRRRLIELGYEVEASTPEGYGAFIRSEIERWTPVVRAAGIKIE